MMALSDGQQHKLRLLIIDESSHCWFQWRDSSLDEDQVSTTPPYKARDMACNRNPRKTTHLLVIGLQVRQSDPEDLGGLNDPPP